MGTAKPGATCCQSNGLTSSSHMWRLRMNSKAKQCDLVEAAKEVVTVISQLQPQRADPEVWNTLCGIHWRCGTGSEIRSSTEQAMQCPQKIPTDIPYQYWIRAIYLPFMDHLLQEMNTWLLVFQVDMPGDLRQLQNEVGRWKTRWDMMNVAERPDTLDNMFQETCTPTCTLQSYWWWCLAEGYVNAMWHLKNTSALYTDDWAHVATSLVHTDTELNAEGIIHQFSCQKNMRLTLLFLTEWRWLLVTEPMLKTIQTLKYNTYICFTVLHYLGVWLKGCNYCKVISFFNYCNEYIAYFSVYDILSHCNVYFSTDFLRLL